MPFRNLSSVHSVICQHCMSDPSAVSFTAFFMKANIGKWSLMSQSTAPECIVDSSVLAINRSIRVDDVQVTRVGASMTL